MHHTSSFLFASVFELPLEEINFWKKRSLYLTPLSTHANQKNSDVQWTIRVLSLVSSTPGEKLRESCASLRRLSVEATWNRFKALVDPFLASVKARFGIVEYRLVLDESTTTPDLIDQNVLYAKILLKPARSIEFIAIDFVITNSGASFDD